MADNEKGKAELSRLLNEPADIIRSALETLAAVNPQAAQAAGYVLSGGLPAYVVSFEPRTRAWLAKKGRVVQAEYQNGTLIVSLVKTR